MRNFRLIYRPYWTYAIADALMLALSFFVVLTWFPLTTHIPYDKYDRFALFFSISWIIWAYLCHRYVRVKRLKLEQSLVRMLAGSILTFATMAGYMAWRAGHGGNLSINVLFTIWSVMVVACTIQLMISYAYRYATTEDTEVERAPERGKQRPLYKKREVTPERLAEIKATIEGLIGKQAFDYLSTKVDVVSSNTYLTNSTEVFNFQKLKYYRFECIINFMPLNQVRGINALFGVVNDKLPDDGLFVCCFEPKSTTKKKLLAKYPPVVNHFVYLCVYLYKRVLPKLVLTSRAYFDMSGGKNRILSRAEVMGRLCYCGFEIVDEHKVGDLMYVVARRAFRPKTVQVRLYGALVKLNRVGKNGKYFRVYKFRTMHPYSEFLQQYIYEKYSLQEGGKFNHDIRVTTAGRFMRKCWLDELPMIFNVLRGEMKLVGVRPLSKQYFSLYSKDLQEQRTRHMPGLLPPFYADMPKTLDEIQESETRYLTMCEEKGTFVTDVIYFGKIVYTILFKRARSH